MHKPMQHPTKKAKVWPLRMPIETMNLPISTGCQTQFQSMTTTTQFQNNFKRQLLNRKRLKTIQVPFFSTAHMCWILSGRQTKSLMVETVVQTRLTPKSPSQLSPVMKMTMFFNQRAQSPSTTHSILALNFPKQSQQDKMTFLPCQRRICLLTILKQLALTIFKKIPVPILM